MDADINDPVQAHFDAAIRRRELAYMRRLDDGAALSYAQRLPQDQFEWVVASGRATLLSFTWIPARGDRAAHNVAWLELDEGPRLISTVTVTSPDALRIGMPLLGAFDAQGRLFFGPTGPDGNRP